MSGEAFRDNERSTLGLEVVNLEVMNFKVMNLLPLSFEGGSRRITCKIRRDQMPVSHLVIHIYHLSFFYCCTPEHNGTLHQQDAARHDALNQLPSPHPLRSWRIPPTFHCKSQ